MEPITINPNRIDLDEAYMQMAEIWAKRSKANRLQVGCLIVKDRQIISDGYNGMPSGAKDDVCEEWHFDGNRDREPGYSGELRTKREVLHAESNALMKISENGGVGAQGATLYTTYSPCFECSKLIRQAKVKRVVFRNVYRDIAGVEFLRSMGIQVDQLGPAPDHSGLPRAYLPDQPSRPPIPVERVAPPAPPVPPIPVEVVQPIPAAPPIVAQTNPNEPTFIEEDISALLAQAGISPIGDAVPAPAPASKGMSIPDGPYKSSFL